MTKQINTKKIYSTTRHMIEVSPDSMIEFMNKHNRHEDTFQSLVTLPACDGRVGDGGLRIKGYFKKSYSDKPLISIITVVFNGVSYLQETIESVINQDYDNVEYIIIDGASTDGTFDIIKKYDDKIDYWVSEPDNGIYDAMNKGISLCAGEIIGIINADDYYSNGALKNVKKEFSSNIDILYSDFNFLDKEKVLTKTANHKLLDLTMSVFHPSVFIKKRIYKKYGRFDSSFKISADYKLLHSFYKKNLVFKRVSSQLSIMRVGGLSANSNLAIEETFHIQKESSVVLAYILKYLRLLKKSVK